eukprot:TRINITY_DN3621_c0_g1_i1.p1 TRINITY_DN3621_c0_g1~~TRINITY_DN3621_c0_g1_i1.p1  ORF type:complete len:488 (+),score=101.30 TRINITY_DN3621_c0_g1_i1:32-1495(+)
MMDDRMCENRAIARANHISSHCSQSSTTSSHSLVPSVCSELFPAFNSPSGNGAWSAKDKKKSDEEESPSNTEESQEELEVSVDFDVNKGSYVLVKEEHEMTFDQGFFYAVRAIELMVEKNGGKVFTVGIAGPSGAGKTTLAQKISSFFDGVIISLEDFVKVERVIDGNMEDPTLVDFDLACQVLTQLKINRCADTPEIIKGNRGSKNVTLKSKGPTVVIMEGLYALNSQLRSIYDISIAINGGVHLDLLKRIVRDISRATSSKDTLFQVTSVLFPMFKAFIEPDLKQALITIHSDYNPMANLVEPTYVCKAKYSIVQPQFNSCFSGQTPKKSVFSDMYLYPPSNDKVDPFRIADRGNWIRIRRNEGTFQIHFYSETMEQNINVRPSINFEISVKTISGLLSLGYQIGAILNRSVEVWHDKNDLIITKEYIKELEKYYVQVKGKNRHRVLEWAEKLNIMEHHLPQTFLILYFKKLKNPKKVKPRPPAL